LFFATTYLVKQFLQCDIHLYGFPAKALHWCHDADFDYAKAQSELAVAAAQLRLIRKIREIRR
jgi:hypothetical protein